MSVERQPPTDLEAEVCLLGSIMLLPKTLEQVCEIAEASDFSDDAHAKLYRAMLAIQSTGRGIDTTTLIDRLRAAGDFAAIGGAAYLGKVMSAVSNAAHAVYYAEIVRDKAILRRLIEAATEILRKAYDPGAEVLPLVAEAEASMAAVGSRGVIHEARRIGDVAAETIAELRASLASPKRPGIMSGVGPLDSDVGPIMPGELAIIAARPGCGKTALAMQFAERAAEKEKTTLFVSLEMKNSELVRRELACIAGIDSRNLRSMTITEGDLVRLDDAAQFIAPRPVWLWDRPNTTMAQIRNTAKSIKGKCGLDLLIVDYLGLIDAARHEQRLNRNELIGKFTRALKLLAKELDCPVVALSQLNREADGQRPRLSHLRESGNIEQDADTVLFVHHDETAGHGKLPHEPREAEIVIAKHRHCAVGIVKVFWTPVETRFSGETEWTG